MRLILHWHVIDSSDKYMRILTQTEHLSQALIRL